MGKAKRLRKAKAARKPSRVLREAARAAVRTLAASTLADALGAAIADVMLRRFASPQFFDGAPCHFCGAEFAARCNHCGVRRCEVCFSFGRRCCMPLTNAEAFALLETPDAPEVLTDADLITRQRRLRLVR